MGRNKEFDTVLVLHKAMEIFGEKGFEGVSMVSIDDDWSAFRMRQTQHIKSMNRSTSLAMSEAGKKKTTNRNSTTTKK